MKLLRFIQLIIDVGIAVEKGMYRPSLLIQEICEIMDYDEVVFLRQLLDHEDMKP